MDLLPKTQGLFRTEVRSAVYRAALRPGVACCYGFLIGTHPEFVSPHFELSVPCACVPRFEDAFTASDVLTDYLLACRELATFADASPVGVFGAWDTISNPRSNQFLGLLIDTARSLDLPYVAVFPTSGGETFWGTGLFFANRFPHSPLDYRTVSGRRSARPAHNLRRIRAQWRTILHSHQLQ